MAQPSLALVALETSDNKKRKQLGDIIQKKQALLQEIVIKIEMLRVNLEMVKQEYMVKIGSLLVKDSSLDLEIIRLKNILQLMNKGLTYDKAVEKVAHTYYTQQLELELELEQKKIDQEEEIYQKREESHQQPTEDIKKVWKKLIAKFHPDLVQNPDEKKKRDTIMKQINLAYKEGDYDKLVKIADENTNDQELTIDNLEDKVITIVNKIIQQNKLYASLRKSDWYNWMVKIEKAKKKNINIFNSTERQLLDDIVAKLDLIKDLKLQIQTLSKSQE